MNKPEIIAFGILFAMLWPKYGHAQSMDLQEASLWGGVMLGGGLFEFVGDGIESPQTSGGIKSGLTVSGHLGYELHRRISLHAEILFARKGSHHLGDGQRLYSYTLNYIELPLLARVSLPSIKDSILPFVAVGPTVSYLLNASGEDVQQGEPLNLDGVYTTIDFGVIFAAGAAVRLTPYDLLSLEARYDMGLRAIVPDREPIYNRGMLLVLGYQTCICSRSATR